jgi:hypothetical protein
MVGALGKVGLYSLALGVLWLCICAGTYVPFFGSPSLSLWRVSQPTVSLGDLRADVIVTIDPRALPENQEAPGPAGRDAGQVRLPDVEAACDHVPFLLRPVAAPPKTARVVFSNDGVERGEVRVDCDTGQMIDGSVRVY